MAPKISKVLLTGMIGKLCVITFHSLLCHAQLILINHKGAIKYLLIVMQSVSLIYFIAEMLALLLQQTTDDANWSALQEAKTLLVPFMVSLINLVVPLFYSLFNKFEIYASQSRQIYVLVIRLETFHGEKEKYHYVFLCTSAHTGP